MAIDKVENEQVEEEIEQDYGLNVAKEECLIDSCSNIDIQSSHRHFWRFVQEVYRFFDFLHRIQFVRYSAQVLDDQPASARKQHK